MASLQIVSEVDVCNQAMLDLGDSGQRISSIETPVIQEETVFSIFFERIYRELLEWRNWYFAREFRALSRNSATPLSRYEYTYNFPNDPVCIKPMVVNESEETRWTAYGRKIHTDETDISVLEYTYRPDVFGDVPGTFKALLANRLAIATAPNLNGTSDGYQHVLSLYPILEERAIQVDIEFAHDEIQEKSSTHQRRGSTRWASR